MMSKGKQTITVRVNLELSPPTVGNVVQTIKKLVGPDEKGRYNVDTHEALGSLISQFLREKNFEDYTDDVSNYIHE